MNQNKHYLGDGAYVHFLWGDIVLTTEDGLRETNRIVLGRNEWQELKETALRYENKIIEDDGETNTED